MHRAAAQSRPAAHGASSCEPQAQCAPAHWAEPQAQCAPGRTREGAGGKCAVEPLGPQVTRQVC